MSTELTVLDRAKKALRSTDHEPVLMELVKQTADIREIKNADGRTQAHSSYMALKNRRTEIRRVGKEARDDATKFSKAVIAEEDRLVSIIEPEETRLQTLRDTWDAARESERREKAQAAQRCKDEIRDKISQLRAIPVNLVGATPERIANAIADVEAFEVSAAEFDDQIDAAHLSRTDVLAKLREMHASAVRRAEEAAQLARERAELDRQRAEQEAREQKAADEAARVDGIKAKISAIREVPMKLIGAPLERVLTAVEAAGKFSATDAAGFAEFAAEATQAAAAAFNQLCSMRDTLIEQRDAAAKLAEQQAEVARQQTALDAERQRLADEEAARQRAADEAAAAAQREREEAAARERAAHAQREEAARLARIAGELPSDALGMLDAVLHMIAEPVGQQCCGRAGYECCGEAVPVYRNADEIAAELNAWREALIARQPVEHKEAA